MDVSPSKQFRITDVYRKKKCLILFESYQSFVRKCKTKFSIPEESVLYFVSEDEEDVEIDSDILANKYAENSLLILKVDANDSKINKRDTVASDTRYKAICSDVDDTDTEEDRNFKSGNGTVARVEQYEVEEWEKIEEGSELKEHISKFGLKDIGHVLKKSLDKWRQKPLHIVITGGSGKGKSSFINSLRGLTPQDLGAAEVDVTECTKVPTPYRHPQFDNFIIWDVPGVGTTEFPQESYLEKINVEKYDFFIVVISERFTAIDSWLMNEARLRNKRRYIIRTKTDNDMQNVKRTRKTRGCFDENKEFIKLKKEIHTEILKSMKGESDFHFFMISNYHTTKYDFPDLELQLLQDVPSEKKTTMMFGVATISKDIVEGKADELRARIWKTALYSGAGAANPIPFLSNGFDVVIILKEVLFYREQFALEDSSLEKLADMANVTLDNLKKQAHLQTPESIFTTAGLLQYLGKYITAGAARKVAQYTIPVLGTMISCGASYKTTQTVLGNILETMKGDALKVLKFVAEKTNEET